MAGWFELTCGLGVVQTWRRQVKGNPMSLRQETVDDVENTDDYDNW